MTPEIPFREGLDELASHYKQVLTLLGEDPEREGLEKTPMRVAKAMQVLTRGYTQDPHKVLTDALFEEKYNQMVIVKDIDFFSMCEHHMLPFYGKAHVAYIPNGHITGLSKIARVVDIFSHRLQVQERLTEQVMQCINDTLKPQGVMVVIEAKHMCMQMRGVRKNRILSLQQVLIAVYLNQVRLVMSSWTCYAVRPREYRISQTININFKSMRGTIRTTVVAICALVITLFTTSCSKDNDIPDAEKNAIQALNNITGNYKGNLATKYSTTIIVWPDVNWNVDKNSTIIVNNFPYQLLADGVSKKTASSLYTTLANEKQRPLKLYITTVQPQDNKVFFNLSSNIKFDITTANETYELIGAVSFNNKQFSSSYTMNNSEMQLQFTIYKLVKINKAHATAIIQEDFDTPVSFNLTGYKR